MVINIGWKAVVLVIFAALLRADAAAGADRHRWAWVALFFLDDFAYYWFHRVSHEVRRLLGEPRRPSLLPVLQPLDGAAADLGADDLLSRSGAAGAARLPAVDDLPAAVVSLIYQFWIHTERIGKLPRPFEFIFNTPSHHRVHHGANELYLDRNYAGILIIWDRMFGTFQGETERVRYGLTTNIRTFNPVKVATHEWKAIWSDVAALRPRDRLGYMFGGPGWSPADRDREPRPEPLAGVDAPQSVPAD